MAYPGAQHTRLEHSFGVMQMVTDIFNSIINKERARGLLKDQYHLKENGFDRYRKIIRLAALLHDLRDSIHTGVSYGLYDRNRLINCIDIGQMPETGDLVLAIQNGGWHIAESLVLARYQMFSQVYFHKTRRAYDHHVSYAVKEILTQGYPQFGGFYPAPEYLDEYVQLDDWIMYGKIKEGLGGKHGTIILERKHYRKVYETSLLPKRRKMRNLNGNGWQSKKKELTTLRMKPVQNGIN